MLKRHVGSYSEVSNPQFIPSVPAMTPDHLSTCFVLNRMALVND